MCESQYRVQLWIPCFKIMEYFKIVSAEHWSKVDPSKPRSGRAYSTLPRQLACLSVVVQRGGLYIWKRIWVWRVSCLNFWQQVDEDHLFLLSRHFVSERKFILAGGFIQPSEAWGGLYTRGNQCKKEMGKIREILKVGACLCWDKTLETVLDWECRLFAQQISWLCYIWFMIVFVFLRKFSFYFK